MVGLIKGKLEAEGFELVLKNDIVSGAAGELAPMDLWPEIWLLNDSEYDEAMSIIDAMKQEPAEDPWRCTLCGESNDPSFDVCWRCQSIPPQSFSK